jgi:hypothetical protein
MMASQVHPGGRRFLESAAGGAVDALWAYWHFHHVSTKVGGFLERYRVGRLSDWEEDDLDGVDMYEADPVDAATGSTLRPAAQVALFDRPWNSESAVRRRVFTLLTARSQSVALWLRQPPAPYYITADGTRHSTGRQPTCSRVAPYPGHSCTDGRPPLPYPQAEVLDQSFYTPNEVVYVRNHAPVPQLTSADHRLSFAAASAGSAKADATLAEFSLAELESRFGTRTVTSVLQCSGNRAKENIDSNGPSGFSGLNFENMKCGMVGNVQWTGVPLTPVLRSLFPGIELHVEGQLQGPTSLQRHVEFHGADGYYSSVPLAHVIAEDSDCLLATSMNGGALPPDHGFPV